MATQPMTTNRRTPLLLAIALAIALVATGAEVSGPPPADAGSGGVGIFSSRLLPKERAVPSARSATVGVLFSSATSGTVSAVQFFRSSRNTGPHRVQLWSAGGSLLGQARYTGRSTGWVTVRLSHRVSIQAGRRYVASYVAPHGHYSRTRNRLYVAHPARAHGLTAYLGALGYGRAMPGKRTHTNYFVDVVFTPRAAVGTPQPTPTPTPTPDPGPLDLARIPWEGGSAYWSQFAKAKESGWDDPGFFPISVFYGKPEHAAQLKALGINTYMGAEHDDTPLTSITNQGMFVLAQQEEFTPAEVGDNPGVVGWFISDECEMGYSGCPEGESESIAMERDYVAKVTAFNDGRFKEANFGNGILRTFWAPTTMAAHVQLMDAASADKYTYTSPDVGNIVPDSPDWPDGATVARAASYGWQVDQMKRFQDPARLRPIWTFVETAEPYLDEPDGRTITPDQIEGAVWSAIIHEARGIAFFQHNSDQSCGAYSLIDCGVDLQTRVTALTDQVRTLAPVINTQSYDFDFGSGTDTMLKTYAGSAYVFADLGLLDSPGDKTFTLPDGVTGSTVTVEGEDRTIPVVDGKFTDNFAQEYTHHIYKIAL